MVWALTRTTIITFPTFARQLRARRKSLRMDEFEKELSFILLQLINGLKFLQAQGREEVAADLDRFLPARIKQSRFLSDREWIPILAEAHGHYGAGKAEVVAKVSVIHTC